MNTASDLGLDHYIAVTASDLGLYHYIAATIAITLDA